MSQYGRFSWLCAISIQGTRSHLSNMLSCVRNKWYINCCAMVKNVYLIGQVDLKETKHMHTYINYMPCYYPSNIFLDVICFRLLLPFLVQTLYWTLGLYIDFLSFFFLLSHSKHSILFAGLMHNNQSCLLGWSLFSFSLKLWRSMVLSSELFCLHELASLEPTRKQAINFIVLQSI